MNEIIALLANIVTILGFPISVFFVIRELGKNREVVKESTKTINNLAESIKNQQNFSGDVGEVHVHNEVKKEDDK